VQGVIFFCTEEIGWHITRDVSIDALEKIETDTQQGFVSNRPRPWRIRCSDLFAKGSIQMMISRLLNRSTKMVP